MNDLINDNINKGKKLLNKHHKIKRFSRLFERTLSVFVRCKEGVLRLKSKCKTEKQWKKKGQNKENTNRKTEGTCQWHKDHLANNNNKRLNK